MEIHPSTIPRFCGKTKNFAHAESIYIVVYCPAEPTSCNNSTVGYVCPESHTSLTECCATKSQSEINFKKLKEIDLTYLHNIAKGKFLYGRIIIITFTQKRLSESG